MKKKRHLIRMDYRDENLERYSQKLLQNDIFRRNIICPWCGNKKYNGISYKSLYLVSWKTLDIKLQKQSNHWNPALRGHPWDLEKCPLQ